MDPKLLLLRMAGRLYEDIRFVTAQNPTQIVDDEGAKAYNSLLIRARKHFPYEEFIEDLSDWQPRTIKYKDALVSAGQLHAMLLALMEREQRFTQPAADHPAASSADYGGGDYQQPADDYPRHDGEQHGDPPSGDFEEKLYGSGPVRRNEDGTIPFSLD